MEKDDLAQRLAFVGLGPEDFVCLEGLRPVLERHADLLVAAFYRHLLSFEPTRALLADADVKRRLRKQREYLLSSQHRPSMPIVAERRATHERVRLAHAGIWVRTRTTRCSRR